VPAVGIARRLDARTTLRTTATAIATVAAIATEAALRRALDVGPLARLALRRSDAGAASLRRATTLESTVATIAAIAARLAAAAAITAPVTATAIAMIAAILMPAALRLVLRHGRHGRNRCQQKRTYHPTHPAILFFARRRTLRLHDAFCAPSRMTRR